MRPLNKGQEEGKGEGVVKEYKLSVLSSEYLRYSGVINNNVYLKLC